MPMTTISDAVDAATDALSEKFPEGMGDEYEMVAAFAIDAANIPLNNMFWEIHQHELERLMLKIGRLEKVYMTAKRLQESPTSVVLQERLQAAIDEYEVNHVPHVA